jgi:signal transduction histidine kinase
MFTARPLRLPRRLVAAGLLFGLFVLLDILLFGWLIIRSLSQRELEKILLETRAEAQSLAERIAGRAQREGKDLYTAVARERETQTYIDSVLRQRDVVRTVEIFDRDGVLVFRGQNKATIVDPAAGRPQVRDLELPPQLETREFERQYDVDVPIGDLGLLHIGISRGELEERIGVLRRDLTSQAGLIGGVTFVLLVTAYLAVWWLWRRGQRLEEQAAEAERLAYVGTLASGLAHEIRNPLNSLSLNMQLLGEELGQAAPAASNHRLLAITRGEIARLERLVSDFLSYARPRPLELEEVAGIALLEHTLEVLAGEIQARRVRVEVADRSGGARVLADRAQMGQLLLNLAHNALAAMEESGRPPRLRLSAQIKNGRVVLEVEDNGVGVPPAERERVFDVFYSTRKGGTGLGLAIVERIARAHGAEVSLRGAPGGGTTVTVALAAAAPRRDTPAPVAAPASAP